jgi:hypothetical protein
MNRLNAPESGRRRDERVRHLRTSLLDVFVDCTRDDWPLFSPQITSARRERDRLDVGVNA